MKIFFLLLLIVFTNKLYSQLECIKTGDNYSINYSYYNNGNTTQANLSATTTSFSKTNPGYTVWCEFGDGGFTFKPRFTHILNNADNAQLNNSLLRLTGIYQNGGKPTRVISNINNTSSNNPSNNYYDQANDFLTSNYFVKITPSVNAIKSDDTMHYAIDYKLPDERRGWKLVFEYNLNESYTFHQTAQSDKIYDSRFRNTYHSFIRTHFNENVNVQFNKIEFLNLTPSNRNKTVFVSLASFEDIDNKLLGIDGVVKAYLVNENDKNFKPNENLGDKNALRNIGDNPHDPNWIKVDKKCVIPSTLGMELNYTIHFQNTGIGNAQEKVHVALKLPDGIIANNIDPITNQFSINYATKPVNKFVQFQIGNGVLNYDTSTVYFDNTTSKDTIHFLFHKATQGRIIILRGMDTTKPNCMNDVRTMGEIKLKFTLPTYSIGKQLIANASIYFDNELPVITEDETIIVKRKCKQRKKAECNCKGKKRGFWQWLKERCE